MACTEDLVDHSTIWGHLQQNLSFDLVISEWYVILKQPWHCCRDDNCHNIMKVTHNVLRAVAGVTMHCLSKKSIWSLPLLYQQPLNNLSADWRSHLVNAGHDAYPRTLIAFQDFECLLQVPPTLWGHPRVPILWRYSLAIVTPTLLCTGLIGVWADSVGVAVPSLPSLHSATNTAGLALLRTWLLSHAKSHDSDDCSRIPLSGPWQLRAVCCLWLVVMTAFSSEHSLTPQMWQFSWRLLYVCALYSSEIPLQLAFSCRTVPCITLEMLLNPVR